MTGFKRRQPEKNQEAVTFRLPIQELKVLDKFAEQDGSSRAAVLRTAIALYSRMTEGMFVPLDAKTVGFLLAKSEAEGKPAEAIAAEVLKQRLSEDGKP